MTATRARTASPRVTKRAAAAGGVAEALTGAGEPAVQSSVLVGVWLTVRIAPPELLGCSSRHLGQHLFQCRLIWCDEGLR